MCGIIGVTTESGESAAVPIYTGLLALQHRGQDSAGIACTSGKRVSLVKAPGLVESVFDEKTLSSLEGSCGIGHVRYATIGASLNRDAQPFMDEGNRIALAYNGNVANYEELSKPFAPLESTCDAEVIVRMLGRAFAADRSVEGVFKGVAEVMEKVNGSYSVVAAVTGVGIVAFRDPHAIMPLAMGRKAGKEGDEYAFASETVALDAIGYEFIRDLKPGEAVVAGFDKKTYSREILPGKPAHCMFQWVYFARPDSTIDGRSVYDARLELGKELAALYKRDGRGADVVVPVPDTSRTAAQAMSEATGVPCREGLIKNRYIGRTFIMPTQLKRDKAMQVKLNPVSAVIEGKRVALVDDSIVRGTTGRKIVALVKKKAKAVNMFVTCPPLKEPCFYGIDFPVRDELIANGRSVEGIREFLGLDGLTYMTLDGLKKAIGLPGLCMACLTGEYPTEISKALSSKVAAARAQERTEVQKEVHQGPQQVLG
ncbi:MAG: amidophosphoribosyltransferase [Candidatus Micrarchaeota archaeon]|nr:amidophosphoribosyltransferase [Candidatus Micrarchaeota archaeon]